MLEERQNYVTNTRHTCEIDIVLQIKMKRIRLCEIQLIFIFKCMERHWRIQQWYQQQDIPAYLANLFSCIGFVPYPSTILNDYARGDSRSNTDNIEILQTGNVILVVSSTNATWSICNKKWKGEDLSNCKRWDENRWSSITNCHEIKIMHSIII